MSPRSQKIRDHVINTVVTVAATFVLANAVHYYETRSEHAADMQRVNDRLERILDLLCTKSPDARQCSSAGEVTRSVYSQVPPEVLP